MDALHIAGGGPAGASAALAARRCGAAVTVFEKSALPRHKVCGEFLSPEIAPALERLEVWQQVRDAGPARIRRMAVHLGRSAKVAVLPEPAWGLSRYAFDRLLLDAAVGRGSELQRESATDAQIWTTGRRTASVRGGRLFGFKAHFDGPCDDVVELYFFERCYVGLNTVENGVTNICGLAPEETLRRVAFEPDALLGGSAALAERVRPLKRGMDWLITGPLCFGNRLDDPSPSAYFAGDALSFIDPFTGSGLLTAVLTGSLAGECAATHVPPREYLDRCRRIIGRPYWFSSLFRELAGTALAEVLLPFVPGEWLYRLTRPRVALTA